VTGSLTRRNFLRLTGGIAAATALEPLAPFSVLSPVRAAEGAISALGPIRNFGAGLTTNGLVAVDIVYTPDQNGYWILLSDGTVAPVDAPFHGHRPELLAGEYVSAMGAMPAADGYWLFTTLGRVFEFGSAVNHGGLEHLVLNGPVVDASPLPDGSGYFMLGSDGGIFAFGSAVYQGSVPEVLPGIALNSPVNGLVPSSAGGYWLVAGDGGIFSFGNAPFAGSIPQVLPGIPLNEPVVGALASGNAYLMVASDGGVFNFGSSIFHGSRPGVAIAQGEIRAPVTCADVLADRSGYLMLDESATPWGFGTSETPIGRDATGAEGRNTHSFLGRWPVDARPFRWPSDELIHYVVDDDFGPPETLALVQDAITDIEAATGLTFQYEGKSPEPHVGHELQIVNGEVIEVQDPREAYQPAVYGDRWAPVWIGARRDISATLTVGTAQPVAHTTVRTTQLIEIDGESFTAGEPTFVTGTASFHWPEAGGNIEQAAAVLRHEIGHLLGLGHVSETTQLMFPSLTDNRDLGGGDLLGLHLLGNANPHPAAPHPSVGVPHNAGALAATGAPIAPRAYVPTTGQCTG
jgi:hypothetical protein